MERGCKGLMKRRLIAGCLAVSLFAFSGCSMMSGGPDIGYRNGAPVFELSGFERDTFAKDLCVVPADYKTENKNKKLNASSTLIFDVTDQEILYADNVYKKLYPASVTKIMTAFTAFKYGDLNDTVTFSYEASHITEWGAKLCGFKEGDKVNLKQLLWAFLLFSGNDAGIAIAEHISGSVEEFAKLMNEEAKKLGALGSNFVNPHGLHDDKHYTTTYDVYLIFNELIKNETFVEMISAKECTVKYKDKENKSQTVTYESTNRYLTGKTDAPKGVTVIGGKTGTTSKAGSCLVLYSQGENGHDYISVVFHAESGDSLFQQMSELLEMIPEN